MCESKEVWLELRGNIIEKSKGWEKRNMKRKKSKGLCYLPISCSYPRQQLLSH